MNQVILMGHIHDKRTYNFPNVLDPRNMNVKSVVCGHIVWIFLACISTLWNIPYLLIIFSWMMLVKI